MLLMYKKLGSEFVPMSRLPNMSFPYIWLRLGKSLDVLGYTLLASRLLSATDDC